MRLRDAGRADARDLAYLINLAGEGLPEYLWGLMAEGGESPLEVGMQRAARQEGGFSYRHARVCIDRGRLVGMILAYRLPDSGAPRLLGRPAASGRAGHRPRYRAGLGEPAGGVAVAPSSWASPGGRGALPALAWGLC